MTSFLSPGPADRTPARATGHSPWPVDQGGAPSVRMQPTLPPYQPRSAGTGSRRFPHEDHRVLAARWLIKVALPRSTPQLAIHCL